MRYPCIESTLDLRVGDYSIRLWINENDIPLELANSEIAGFVQSLDYRLDHKQILELIIDSVPNLNAIQIKNGEYGVVVYTKEFSEGEDVHG